MAVDVAGVGPLISGGDGAPSLDAVDPSGSAPPEASEALDDGLIPPLWLIPAGEVPPEVDVELPAPPAPPSPGPGGSSRMLEHASGPLATERPQMANRKVVRGESESERIGA